jgi:hypothetical protein
MDESFRSENIEGYMSLLDLVLSVTLEWILEDALKAWTGSKRLRICTVNEFCEYGFRFSSLLKTGNFMITRVITSFPAIVMEVRFMVLVMPQCECVTH